MTIRSFLQEIDIADHTDTARYPDGSGGKDGYALFVRMDGHGKLLNAKVNRVSIGRGVLCIAATGEKEQEEET